MRTSSLAIVAAALVSVALVGQQQPNRGPSKRADAAISGVVTDALTKEPIPDALVQAGKMDQANFPISTVTQFTDAKGRFVFTDLAGGDDYFLRAAKTGYFDAFFGSQSLLTWPGALIHLADAQWFQSGDLSLTKHGSLTGTVTDERGDPLIDVFVQALSEIRVAGTTHLASSQVTQTDDRGVYRVGGLTPGRYRVMVLSSPAAASPALMREAAASAALRGDRFSGTDMASGPAIDVGGRSKVVLGKSPVPPPPSDGHAFAYPITFAGGSLLAQAAGVNLGAGEELTGIDVHVEPMSAVRIAGRVDGPAAERDHLTLRLLAQGLEELTIGSEAGTAVVASDGTFEFPYVPAGHYTIEVPLSIGFFTAGARAIFYSPVIPQPPSLRMGGRTGGYPDAAPPGIGLDVIAARNRSFARVPVTVGNRDVTNVVVSLQPAASMHGKLVGEPDPAVAAPLRRPQFMTLESATGDASHGIPRPVVNLSNDGTFTIEGILPGPYVFQAGDNNGWIIKSVRVGGRDCSYIPIDLAAGTAYDDVVITFTNAIPSLAGTVRDRSGAVAKGAAVIVFPVEPDQWQGYGLNPRRIRTGLASSNGGFQIRPLPAGDYYVLGLPAAQKSAWQEPGFFIRAAGLATRVTVDWGERKTIDIQMSEIR